MGIVLQIQQKNKFSSIAIINTDDNTKISNIGQKTTFVKSWPDSFTPKSSGTKRPKHKIWNL